MRNQIKINLLLGILMILFCLVLVLACEHKKTITPPESKLFEPNPGAWIPLGLSQFSLNRLVLSGDWLYACTTGDGGLYRINHPAKEGDLWQFLGLSESRVNIGHFGVTDIVSRNDTIVAGFNVGNSLPEIAGIYRSIDDGRVWVAADSGFIRNQYYVSSSYVRSLVQSPFDPRMILAGCSSGCLLYLSRDFGLSWEMIFDLFYEGPALDVIGFHPGREKEIWAGGVSSHLPYPYLYRSTDLGLTWQELLQRPYNPDALDVVQDLAFDPVDGNTIYVCLSQVIIKTTDNGASWFPALDTLKTGVFWNMNAHPSEKIFFACATDSLYYTANDCQEWKTFIAAPECISRMSNLAVDWERKTLYVTTYNPSQGIFRLNF